MPQIVVILLMVCALVLPIAGAAILRFLAPRLDEGRLTLAAALLFVLAAGSVLVLARADVSRIQVAGLTVLLPVVAPADGAVALPPALVNATPAPDPSDEDHGDHGDPAATPAATATPEPTATAMPSATPEPPTATVEPTATPEPPTATPEPPTATPEPAGPRRYTVQPGDTLRSIAEQFGVTVAAILEANDLTPQQADSLRPGQELIIP